MVKESAKPPLNHIINLPLASPHPPNSLPQSLRRHSNRSRFCNNTNSRSLIERSRLSSLNSLSNLNWFNNQMAWQTHQWKMTAWLTLAGTYGLF